MEENKKHGRLSEMLTHTVYFGGIQASFRVRWVVVLRSLCEIMLFLSSILNGIIFNHSPEHMQTNCTRVQCCESKRAVGDRK